MTTRHAVRCTVLSLGVVLAGCGPPVQSPLGPGAQALPLAAPEWINGDAPAEQDLKGKVVVVELWAHWCGYCKANAQELVQLEKKYRDQEVAFIAFTPDGRESLLSSQEWLKAQGVTWPSGIDASATIEKLRAPGFPMTYVIGRDGKIVWNSDVPGDIVAAIDAALERK